MIRRSLLLLFNFNRPYNFRISFTGTKLSLHPLDSPESSADGLGDELSQDLRPYFPATLESPLVCSAAVITDFNALLGEVRLAIMISSIFATAVATVPPSQSPPSSASPSRSRSPSPPPALRSHPNPYSLRSRHRNKKPSGSRTGRVRTLADLHRPSTDGSGSDSDDQPQEYYTGGEKSGMLVQDPSHVTDVDVLFTQARQAGAVEGPLENLHPLSSSRSFTGTGRLLSGETVSSAPQPPEVVTRNIIFWSDGFTVDDGPRSIPRG
ncbi:hypothetical protein CsSME_00006178 [Camellia sinensis var. sinensis]